MNQNLEVFSSTLASTLRLWRGTWGDRPARTPEQLLVLFDREDDAACRLVREALTGLNFDAMVYPCPLGGKRFAAERKKRAPAYPRGPVLHDPNSGDTLAGADQIIAHLFARYLEQDVPAALKSTPLNLLGSQLASRMRAPLGISVRPSKRARQSLTLYSFESSPFSRLVRERLCALELHYHLINLGKLEWKEMGPATLRPLAPVGYAPIAGSKRDAFFKEHGNVQVPYLIDPNHAVGMFESAAILAYLERNYAK